jgi:hypothetical protein
VSDQAVVAFYDSNRVVGLYKDDFDFDTHAVYVLGELLARKLLSSICNELIRRA